MSDDRLDPEVKNRLRAELDRVQPRFSSPRYLSSPVRPVAWRFAPAVLIASVISMLALSAYAATGSPNPADWGHEVVTIINSSSTTPTPTLHPTPKATPTPSVKPSEEPIEHESPEPSAHESPEPAEHESPQPSGGHSGGGSDTGDSHEGSTSDSG